MIVRIVILIYIGLGFFLFLFQRSYIYFPQYTNFPLFDECLFYTIEEKIDHNGAKFYEIDGAQDTVIVYYHGNAGNACDRYEMKDLLAQTGATLLFVEYPGYAGDTDKTTEQTIENAVDNVHHYLSENYGEETQIIVIGRSIGTGAASYHAQGGSVDALILISPFTSLADVAQLHYKVYPASLLVKDRFDNVHHLDDFGGDLTVIHGQKDAIVPQILGKALFDSIDHQQKQFISIEDGDHNNLMEIETFRKHLSDRINDLMDPETIAED